MRVSIVHFESSRIRLEKWRWAEQGHETKVQKNSAPCGFSCLSDAVKVFSSVGNYVPFKNRVAMWEIMLFGGNVATNKELTNETQRCARKNVRCRTGIT
jgi:hypothetical protein